MSNLIKTMKRFLLLAVLGIVSCTALDDPTPGVGTPVSVTFEVGSYGSFPTKGMADAIAATLPAALDLQLTNTATGATYTAQTGAAVEIPAGTYEVTGATPPTRRTPCTGLPSTYPKRRRCPWRKT